MIRRPVAAPGRRRRRCGADRLGRARARLGLRLGRPARAGDRAPARRRPGVGDPAQPQRGAAAVGAGPERARPGRPGAVDRRPGGAGVARPDDAIATDPDVLRAGRSVVRVLGTACGLGVEGSGWAVAPGLIVTNAHVVAGSDDTTVTTQDGVELDATPVYYDPGDDLALLRVGADLPTLPISADREPGSSAAVLGYPENGPYASAPARLGETQDDGQRGLLRPRPGRSHDHRPAWLGPQRQLRRAAGRRPGPGRRHRLRRHHLRLPGRLRDSRPRTSATPLPRPPPRSTPGPAPAEREKPITYVQ